MSLLYPLGYRPELEAPAKAALAQAGTMPIYSAASFGDAPLEDGFSLSDLIIAWFNQGQVGSCGFNATASSVQISIGYSTVYQGLPNREAILSRSFLWYHGRRLDGLLGSRGDGGSVTNALRAAREAGCPPESLAPYSQDRRVLERAPSEAATRAAKQYGIKGQVNLDWSDPDSTRRMIRAGQPPVIGVWWNYGWDQGDIDQYGRAFRITDGVFGHALCLVGWAVWGGKLYWQILNSHGAIYPLPSPEMRSIVRGYASARPDRCYCFWCPDGLLRTVAGYGNAEIVAPVGPFAPTEGRPMTWSDAWS